MKERITSLIAIFVLIIFCLASCGDDEHTHTPGDAVVENEVTATCTSTGSYDEVIYCSECDEEISRTAKTIERLSHTPSDWLTDSEATCEVEGAKHKECTVCHTELETGKIDKLTTHTPAEAVKENEVDSSCSKLGSYDEVVYCSVCETTLSREKKEIAKKNHTEVTDKEAAPTCTETGLTEGKHCSVCGEVTIAQTVVGALGHTDKNSDYECDSCEADLCTEHKEETIPAVAATCTTAGLTAGKKCSVCGDILVAQTKVDALGHTDVTDAAVEATDTTDGLTEGKHCEICNEILVAQEVIPARLQGTAIKSALLTVDGDRIHGSLSNATTLFSFLNDITVNGNASYIVSRDIECTQTIPSKTAAINEGDNIFYILVTNGNTSMLYTVQIHRIKMCNVSFNTDGGALVDGVLVEEGQLVSEPTTSKEGYLFAGWNYDFNIPITDDTVITASWTPRNDTKYWVNYYTENSAKDGYDLIKSIELCGVTDTVINADILTYNHFSFNQNISTASGAIVGDGSLVLNLYYDRNTYIVSISEPSLEDMFTISGVGSYVYEDAVSLSVDDIALGYEFLGWYNEDTLLSDSLSYTATIESNITAKVRLRPEMSNFIFSSSPLVCLITGVKDSSVTEISVPDYVTDIFLGSFKDCQALEKIELYFTGSSSGSDNTHFGYIFGADSYAEQGAYVPSSLKTVILKGKGAIKGSAFYGCSNITEIQFSPESNYVSIGEYAFYGCTGLANITIPNSVTSIDYYSFYGCTGFTSVTIPDSVTSIGPSAFEGCTGLTSIAIPDSVTNIGSYAFSGCAKPTSVTIPNSVTSIGSGAFSGCSSLESITLPFVGSCIKSANDNRQYPFGYIFGTLSYTGGTATTQYYHDYGTWTTSSTYYIPSTLKEVTITGGNILYGAFYNCTGLTSITILDDVTSIGSSAFYGCSSLESITLPFVGDSIKTADDTYQYPFGYIFGTEIYTGGTATTQYYRGSSTTSTTSTTYYIPASLKSVTITGGNILYGAFDDCAGLTSITIPDSITSIGSGAFEGCTDLANITIPDSVTSIGYSSFADCTSLTSITIPNSVTSIGNYAFEGCTGLTSITIPNSVTSIGYQVFQGCTGLTSITIPNSVTSIGNYAFEGCTGLTSITIPDSVTSIGNAALSGCSSLESVTLPFVGDSIKTESDTYQYPFGYIFGSISYTGSTATRQSYYGSSTTSVTYSTYYIPDSLKSVTITGGNILSGAFEGCTGLTSITIADSITSIGSGAFEGCTGLTSITIADSVTSIDFYAFYDCTSLTSVYITDIAKWCNISFEGAYSSPFFCADNLYLIDENGEAELITELVIPDGVTSISEFAFYYCMSLTSITIPDSVTSIGDYAFYYCMSLTSIKYNGTISQWKAIAKDYYSFYNVRADYVQCTDGTVYI